jgi:MFS family permease
VREPVPLRRNRDFMLLQSGQLLSSAGSQSTAIAYPLLVLAITGSPAQTGLVSFARLLPLALFAIPAGLAADRWSRKALMIGADVVRVVAIGTLAAAVITDQAELWLIVIVAFVEGAGSSLFAGAESGALRATVPIEQLPAAAGAQTGRRAAVQLAGPPIGGALFGLAHALPFVADCASYSCSTASLVMMRTPFEEERAPAADRGTLRTRVAEGFAFLWQRPFLRTCALLFGLANFVGPGLLFAVVVIGRHHGVRSATIGLLVGAFAACILVGSFLAPYVRRRLPAHAVLLLELWAWPGCALFLVWSNVFVLVAGMLPAALVIPSTDSVVHGYRIAMTPDRMLGRAEAVRATISLSIAPLGPLLAGLLLDRSERVTIAVFALAALALAVWGTASRSLRNAPPFEALATLHAS